MESVPGAPLNRGIPRVKRWNQNRRGLVTASTLLVVSICSTLLFARPPAKIPDDDMREIIRLLFERELHPDGKEIAVLLGPNWNAAWIPKHAGIQFKQLTYDEQKQGMEYYDLHTSYLSEQSVTVELSKGNYCKKVGTRYRVHKQGSSWEIKVVGASESGTIGEACPNCALESAELYSVSAGQPAPSPRPARQKEATEANLILTGKVLGVSCSRLDKTYIECRANLDLTFSNKGNRPVIMLQPFGEDGFWHGATALALSQANSEKYSYVYSNAAWPSIYTFPIYQQLAESLDKPSPPPDATRVIKPQESWIWSTPVQFRLYVENHCDMFVGVEIGWNQIRKLSSPLWLRVSYELWPFNVENFRKNLGGKLRKRWEAFGVLYLEEKKSGRYWQAILRSEPIELDLRGIELTNSAQ